MKLAKRYAEQSPNDRKEEPDQYLGASPIVCRILLLADLVSCRLLKRYAKFFF
jgi:hypothetical protein